MKIFMIGGTGLLGSEAAKELIARGHEVASIALPPLPQGAELPKAMKLVLGNYLEMSDEEIKAHLADSDAFVFAAGVDERVEGHAPIYDLYKKYNIDPIRRLLPLAKEAGVKHAVILGSYFAYFNRIWPEMELTKWHPYIRSRKDQEDVALSFASEDFDVAVLELPYIFGTQPGRKPVWLFLVEILRGMGRENSVSVSLDTPAMRRLANSASSSPPSSVGRAIKGTKRRVLPRIGKKSRRLKIIWKFFSPTTFLNCPAASVTVKLVKMVRING